MGGMYDSSTGQRMSGPRFTQPDPNQAKKQVEETEGVLKDQATQDGQQELEVDGIKISELTIKQCNDYLNGRNVEFDKRLRVAELRELVLAEASKELHENDDVEMVDVEVTQEMIDQYPEEFNGINVGDIIQVPKNSTGPGEGDVAQGGNVNGESQDAEPTSETTKEPTSETKSE